MIFKLSNIHRAFFTYFCPTFYGSPPAAPSNTTSTQTINQSPWQNPVYQSLMLGTKDAPGPVTSMLKSSAEQTAQWNAINKAGLSPASQASLGTWNPDVKGSTSTYVDRLNKQTGQFTPTANPKAAANTKLQAKAQGGIAALRGYAVGKVVAKPPAAKAPAAKPPAAKAPAAKAPAAKAPAAKAPAAKPPAAKAPAAKAVTVAGNPNATTIARTTTGANPTTGAKKPAAKSTGNVIQDAAVEALGRQLTPAEYTNLTTTTPAGGSKAAALKVFKALPEGVKYAKTQATAALAKTPAGIKAAKLTADVKKGTKLSPADNKYLSNYRTNATKLAGTGIAIDPTTGKAAAPKYPQGATAAEKAVINKKYTAATGNTVTASGAVGPKKVAPKAPYDLMDTQKKVAYFDPVTGKSTNADFLAIQKKARELGTPEQFAKGTAAYDKALAATEALQNYKPTDVSATKSDVVNAGAASYLSQGMTAPEAIAAQKAGVTNADAASYLSQGMTAPEDIAAQKAGVTNADAASYLSSNMTAPEDIAAQGYEAAQMTGAADVKATKAGVTNMANARDIKATKGTADQASSYLSNAPSDISAQDYEAEQAQGAKMEGPGSWTDAGTAEQYMNPYMQNVVDIQKRESNRDYAKQLNELSAQSVRAGAFGGSRQAIERAEAARNQATKLADIQEQGLSQAYTSGMGQFTNEQGQQLQAGQANLSAEQQTQLANQSATNAQRQQYIQNALDAAKTSYGGQLSTEQANAAVQNATSQFNTNAKNTMVSNYLAQGMTADQANQQADLATNQQNANAANTAENAYAQQQLGANQGNQQIQQQTGSINQAATNAQRQQYVQNALAAAQTSYGGKLTAAQQNQVAANAASQYNASNQQQANLTNASAANTAENAYVQNALAAAQTSYGGQLTAAQQNQVAANAASQYNASNQQQANLTNASAANTAENAYVQNALAAAQTSYGGQLTAAQQNQVAANAASQYNASNQQQANLTNASAANTAENAYVQQQLAAAQTSYGGQLTAAQQNQVAANAASQYNASNQQQANLTNAGAANTANLTYAQQQLAASQGNQAAGLTANSQNAAAAGQLGNIAQGIGALGTAQNAVDLANLGAQGQVAQAEQNLGQSYADAQTANAQNWLGASTNINSGVLNAGNAQTSSGGWGSSTSGAKTAKRGGLIRYKGKK